MKSKYAIFLLFCVVALQAQEQYLGELPENPEPGKCYVKQTIPDDFEIKTFRILEVPAHKTVQVFPAEYKVVREEVVVRPAVKNYKYIPPSYTTTVDTIWIDEPYNKVIASKPVFSDDYEDIEIKGKSGKWVVEKDPNCSSNNPDDCRVFHYREIPGVVDKIPVKKLFAPVRITTKRIGGEYKLIKRQVLASPARTVEVMVPEEKKIVERRVLVKDEVAKEIDVPAKYKTVERRVITKKGSVSWKEVSCGSKSNTALVLPINFKFGSANLTDESKAIIDEQILPKLIENKGLMVQVGSHTDSRGSEASNQYLSERRSKSVVEYLNKKGIKNSRMIAVGYGESQLLNKCKDGVNCSENQHFENRRTEFKLFKLANYNK